MALLAIDIGNSDVKLGVLATPGTSGWAADTLWTLSRIPTPCFLPGDAGHRPPPTLPSGLATHLHHIDHWAISSVVPHADDAVTEWLRSHRHGLPLPLRVLPGAQRYPIHLGRYPARQLGADRLVNLCAAAVHYPDQDLVVVDFGTATTLNVLLASERTEGLPTYQGGAITPGLQSFAGILSRKTAQLTPVPLTLPTERLGTDTQSCLQVGIGVGYVKLIQGLLDECRQATPHPLRVIGTGGLAATVQGLAQQRGISLLDDIDEGLTLKGLRVLYDLHAMAIPA